MVRIRQSVRDDVAKAPQTPGVYSFLGIRDRLLYVGKAVNVRARLKSHLAEADTANPAKAKLLSEAHRIVWETVDSEPEALIREAELIKQKKPRYNVLLRDDKNYFFVAFTKELFPKVYLTHQPARPGSAPAALPGGVAATYVGPFTDGGSLKRMLKLLRKTFPYCTCKTPHARPCLAAVLGRCAGACCLKEAKRRVPDYAAVRRRYREGLVRLKAVLTGERVGLARTLRAAMQRAATAQEFERAAQLRDQLEALEAVFSHRPVVVQREMASERQEALLQLGKLLGLAKAPIRLEIYDMSHHQGASAVGSLVVFTDGMPEKAAYRRFKVRGDAPGDTDRMRQVITRRLAHTEWPLADVLAVDGGLGQISAAREALGGREQTLPVVGLAKGRDELHVDWRGQKRVVSRASLPRPLRHLLTHLQDEAHRFAITYHRRLHRTSVR